MSFQWPGEKLVEKMWDTLAEKGVGSLLKPWQTIRVGNAQVEVRRREMLALAQAEADAAEIKAGKKRLQNDGTLLAVDNNAGATVLLLPGVEGRIEPAFDINQFMLITAAKNAADHVNAEINVARTVIMAEEILAKDTQEPPSASIEDDWLSTWREYVGKVSNEELQRLWANILAGEVKAPGTYSARTLEFLRTLSKAEAERIAKLASFVIDNGFIVRELDEVLEANGMPFATLLEMQELGILTGVDAMGLSMTYTAGPTSGFTRVLMCHGKILIVQHDGQPKLQFGVYMLTTLGKEIITLGTFAANKDYLIAVGKKLINSHFKVTMADVISLAPSGGINYVNAVPISN